MKSITIKKLYLQNGSSLIETMVSLFVLAIGLLGTLAMQTKSIQHNQNSYSYSQAIVLANDLSERLRTAQNMANVKKNWEDVALKESLPSGKAEIKNGDKSQETQSISLEFFGGINAEGNKHTLKIMTWTSDNVSK